MSFFSVWTASEVSRIKGPTRLISLSADRYYLVSDQWLLTLSQEGNVLDRLNIKNLNIYEPLADITGTENQDLYLGLQRSQEILRISSEGKFISRYPRTPSSFVTDTRVFGLTMDPTKEVLYLSDTVHHTLEIYGKDKQLIKKLRAPYSADPYQKHTGAQPFTFPLGMVFYKNRLYVADTDNSRIVVLFPDGTLDRSFNAVNENTGRYIYPRRVSRNNNYLYFVNLGPRLKGGQVIQLDLNTEQYLNIHETFPMDPVDVLARENDLLVVDSKSMSIHRFNHDGAYLGLFGSQELQSFYVGTKIQQKTYQWLRFISLGIVVVILAGLVALNRRQKRPQIESSPSPLKISLREMPAGKRRLLIGVVPGLGYWAASRYIEFMAVLLIMLFVILVVYFEFSPTEEGRHVFSVTAYATVTILIGIVSLAWTFTTVHASGLVEASSNRMRLSAKASMRKFVGVPVIAAVAVIVGQGVSEITMTALPFLSKIGGSMSITMSSMFDVLTGKEPSEIGYLARIFPTDLILRQSLAWGLGTGAIFWALSHYQDSMKDKSGRYALLGIILGMLIWIVNKGFLGNVLGSGFILILTLGLSTGVVTYLVFRKNLSALSITAAMAGAWLGSTIYIMLLGSGYDLPLPNQLMGFGIRAVSNASAVFLMAIFLLFVQHVLSESQRDII